MSKNDRRNEISQLMENDELSTQQMFRDLKDNKDIQRQMQQRIQPAEAERIAEGRPEQVRIPAQMTMAGWMRQTSRKLAARLKNRHADHISYGILEQIVEREQTLDQSLNSILPNWKALEKEKPDSTHVLRAFMYGHKTDKKGQPLNASEQTLKQVDQEFVQDYLSDDLAKRRAHLARMVEDLLDIHWTLDMFTSEYMQTGVGVMYQNSCKMSIFEKVMKDRTNKPYFDELPQKTKDLLQRHVLNRYAIIEMAMSTILGTKGISMSQKKYIEEDAYCEEMKENMPYIMEILQQTLRDTE
ncbi:MAG: hypothetical protein J6B28_08895 [Eubacterium sp.]|nr:hypothetical protein [Eubacterium sp.]